MGILVIVMSILVIMGYKDLARNTMNFTMIVTTHLNNKKNRKKKTDIHRVENPYLNDYKTRIIGFKDLH